MNSNVQYLTSVIHLITLFSKRKSILAMTILTTITTTTTNTIIKQFIPRQIVVLQH